ncbi:MAG: serine protease [Myxococcota bacterium]|nr:serine protease [Myxococcota bacterium]
MAHAPSIPRRWHAVALAALLVAGCASSSRTGREADKGAERTAEVSDEASEAAWAIAPPPAPPEGSRGSNDPAYELAHRSTVLVTTSPRARMRGGSLGTGVLLHDDGWIVTTAKLLTSAAPNDDLHVVVYVRFKEDAGIGSPIPAVLHKWDLTLDLAVLKLVGGHEDAMGPPLDTVGPGELPGIGGPIGCIGHAGNLWKFSRGVVSAVSPRVDRDAPSSSTTYIETDCDPGRGDIGTLLLESDGRVAGIKTGTKWALPWEVVRDFISDVPDDPMEVMP